jgi:hypothetical protein
MINHLQPEKKQYQDIESAGNGQEMRGVVLIKLLFRLIRASSIQCIIAIV